MGKDLEKRQATKTTELQSATAEEQIRQRAYELYEARGRQDGYDLDDWRQAEAEITAIQGKAVAA